MTSFTGSPRLIKGAIVSFDILSPVPEVITFQYNPITMTRSLQPQTVGESGGDRGEALRLKGAPVETIKLELELDATDRLEQGDGLATKVGLYPQLSALEMLLYPKSSLVIANTIALALGTMEVLPPVAPLTLLIWGPQRVLPVAIDDLSFTEDAHDVNLNPIRAKVSLGLRVLSYNDLSVFHPGYHLFLAHQIVKETQANLNSLNNIAAIGAEISI